ncbi:AAA family ATPase [Variovorax ginsengisoli]|uniref:AAA family ATPase n=1 Tax=Variovorax ginsengisoli TaxID=363844 RepID=A0ABT8S040_9BURK|nr:AAA family ATPase [Variovorax ginsengisoli]MDN8612404.1 AAA family ATPase [Variovorax ginsengisoli]MDO1531574.1 AAA family ATPase [Variovorax ginsengisoli]
MVSKKKRVSVPPGYGIHADPGDLSGEFCEPLLLPIWLLEQLEVEALERERLLFEERERKRAEDDAAYKARQEAAEEERSKRPPPPVARSSLTPLQAAQALTVPDELPPAPPNTVAVFDWHAARERFDSLKRYPATADKEIIARDLRHFAKAMANGPWRTVARSAAWREDLQQLAEEMPNFAVVVEAIQRAMALADLSGRPPALQPILLLGAPGVGKTHFTHRLAESLQTTIHLQSFDNAQSNTLLRGSERHWSNSSVGALWELIVLGEKANPVVLLDEIDKGANEGGHHRPVDALLSLLEPVTAARVKDVSVDFEFDASHVVYVATANDAGRIAAPVRSRFLEFFIKEPDIDGRLVLAHSIFQATLNRMVPSEEVRATFARPTDLQICRLAWMTPRQIRMTSEQALGAAAYEGRRHFEDRDFDAPKPRTQVAATSRRPKDGDGDEISVFVVRS